MRVNTAKQKLLRGEPAFGYALNLGSPLVAERLSHTGIDYLLLDNQHGSWGPDSTIMGLAACAAGTAVPMARVAFNNFTMIGRLLDEGALGLVIPMVNTPEDAAAAAMASRFPPVGNRSWGWGRAMNYGSDYPEWINDQLFLAIQIESVQALENAEAIMATPGIDGCWVGPADLALSMGFTVKEGFQREEHARALERIVQACRNTGKVPGIAGGSPEDGVRRAQQGFRFITAGGDAGFLMNGAMAGLKILQEGAAKLRG